MVFFKMFTYLPAGTRQVVWLKNGKMTIFILCILFPVSLWMPEGFS